jgi:hypothetical protein
MWYSKLGKKTFISRHILHQNWYTCPIYQWVETRSKEVFLTVSATSAPALQPLRQQRNLCHPVVNRFTRKTLPRVNRKHLFVNNLFIETFFPQYTHNRTLLFSSTSLKHGRHFDYWNQPLNMSMCVCCVYYHEGGLCCYLVIHIENLLRSWQLFYFHLYTIYWAPFVWKFVLVFQRVCFIRNKKLFFNFENFTFKSANLP